MKSFLFFSTFLFFVSSFAESLGLRRSVPSPKGEELEIISMTGQIKLINQKKELKELTSNSQLSVDLVGTGLKNFLRALAGDSRLVIYNGKNEFSFLITRKSFDAKKEFRTHQQYTGQSYHIQMTKEAKNLQSVVSEKIIDCTYSGSQLVPRTTTDSDGNSRTDLVWELTTEYGKQKARVNDQTWQERQNYTIFSDSGQLNGRTQFALKSYQTVLKELTACL